MPLIYIASVIRMFLNISYKLPDRIAKGLKMNTLVFGYITPGSMQKDCKQMGIISPE